MLPVEGVGARRPQVVVVGAGFGGLTVARHLASVPVDVTLVDRNNYHLFTPFVYQVASGLLSPGDVAPSIRSQIRSVRNTSFLRAEVTGIDTERSRIVTDHGAIRYDYLVLAPGSVSDHLGVSYAMSLKTLPDALGVRNAVVDALERASWEQDPGRRHVLRTFVIVGGGPVGVEYAGAVVELLRTTLRKDFKESPREAKVILLEAGPRILPLFDERLSVAARRSLEKMGVEVRTDSALKTVEQGVIDLEDGSRIEAGTVIWAAGVRASPLGRLLGVPLTRQGRVPVTPTLQVQSLPNVFVIGDLAASGDLPMLIRPALEEAEHVAKSIHRLLLNEEPKPFLYRDPGIMAIVGRGSAVAQIGPFRFSGFIGWLIWLGYHVLRVNTFRSRVAALTNWAVLFLFREPPIRLEVRAGG